MTSAWPALQPASICGGKAVGLNIARAGRVESYALPAALVRESVAKLLETHLTSTPAAEKPPQPAPANPAER